MVPRANRRDGNGVADRTVVKWDDMSDFSHTNQQHRLILQRIAEQAMVDRGLLPAFSAAASREVQNLDGPAPADAGSDQAGIKDLRTLPWSSIDNDDSRDLDQLTVAETKS